MILNKKELKKIQYDFNSISNRLLQANFADYLDVLKKFILFLENTTIIYDYIVSCGECTQNLEEEFRQVENGCGDVIFLTGDTREEEVRNVYAILKYITEKNIDVHRSVAEGYSYSTKFSDRIKEFNHRFVMILIRHIESYLTKMGIDMGLDERITYNVSVRDGQAIIASDNAVVHATNTAAIDTEELFRRIEAVRNASLSLPSEEQVPVQDGLEVIEVETSSIKPRKGMLKTAMSLIKGVKGTVEFAAAVAALIEFVQMFL